MSEPVPPSNRSGGSVPSEATFELLSRARTGDGQAIEVLFGRYLPRLRRWASGRLPKSARSATDTQDLVQDVLIQVFRNVGRFEPRREGAFQAYLRQAVMNRIRNAIRDRGRRPDETGLDEDVKSADRSPLETAIGIERLEKYEGALSQLREIEREAIVARLEMGCTYEEMAALLDLPSAEAARKAVARALVRLTAELTRIVE